MQNIVKKSISIFFLLFQLFNLYSEKNNKYYIDSLEQILKTEKNNQKKLFVLNELSKKCVKSNPDKALEYLKNALLIAEQIKDSANIGLSEYILGFYLDNIEENDSAKIVLKNSARLLKKYNKENELADCYNNLAGIYFEEGNYIESIFWFNKSTEVAKIIKDENLECKNLMYIGMAYNQMGDHPKGLIELQKALKIAETHKYKKTLGQVLLFIGSTYSEGSNEEYAVNYFKRCQKIATEEKDTLLLIEVDMYIANNHYYNKRYEKAIEIYNQVGKISAQNGDQRVYAGALGNLGNVYADMGENEKGLEFQFKAVKIFEEEGDNQGLTICYNAIGESYYNLKHYDHALEYFQKALKIATEMNSLEDLIEIHLGFSKTYEAINEYKKAYESFKLYKQYNDSVFNKGNTKKITELELNFRFQAQQKEQELTQKNKEILADEKLKRQKLLSYSSIVGIFLLLLLVGFVFRSSTQRKKANIKLQEFNDEILLQKEVIEHKNKEITDSINYAKRIQESILPIRTEIQNSFVESFVFFKPRDVVSGDFYWFTQHKNKKIIACVDCTGHGVPGAFMSMIGNTLLNEIVNEKGIVKPSEILNLLHERVRQSLKQDLENSETRDGMDIAICVFDEKNSKLEYAGANRPLYFVRNNKLEEIKANKQPIGGDKIEEDRKFTNHKLPLQPNDSIYLLTDGYADQFGGEKGKKFMVKRFHQTLLDIQTLSMIKQGEALKQIIETWQGSIEQVDDILVMGIKI